MYSSQERKPSLPSIKNLLDMAPRVDEYRPIHDPSSAESFDVLHAGAQPVQLAPSVDPHFAYRSGPAPPAVQWSKGYGYSAADQRRSSVLSPPSSPEASSLTDSYGSSTSPRSSVSYSPRPSIPAQQYEQQQHTNQHTHHQQQNYYAQPPPPPQQRGYAPYPHPQPYYPPPQQHAIMPPTSPIVDQRRMSSVPVPIAATSPTVQLASNRYQCPYCPKRFSRPSSLRIHTFSHTGEKPFCCQVPGCGRKFSVQSNMRRHLRVHRGQKE